MRRPSGQSIFTLKLPTFPDFPAYARCDAQCAMSYYLDRSYNVSLQSTVCRWHTIKCSRSLLEDPPITGTAGVATGIPKVDQQHIHVQFPISLAPLSFRALFSLQWRNSE